MLSDHALKGYESVLKHGASGDQGSMRAYTSWHLWQSALFEMKRILKTRLEVSISTATQLLPTTLKVVMDCNVWIQEVFP